MQNTFVKDLNQFLLSNANVSRLIVGGDWNVALGTFDKKGGIPWRPTTYRDYIIAMCEELDLIDILRKKKPNAKLFTYESKPLKMKSRIDYFLIANSMSHLVSHVNIGISIALDHRVVRLNVNLTPNKRGPSLWKFNNSLLLDDEFVSLIETSYSAISEKFCELDDKQLKWEMIKMELRGLIIQYAKRKARKSRDYLESLEQRLAETETFINNSNESDGNLETKLTIQEQLKKELQYLYEKRGEGTMSHSKLRWTEQGEKPTRYFFNMEAKNFNQKTITELETSEGVKITGHKQLLQEIETFYQNLYHSEYAGSHELFADFVHSVQHDKENLEGELTSKSAVRF